jgi:hypothetical protein
LLRQSAHGGKSIPWLELAVRDKQGDARADLTGDPDVGAGIEMEA